MACTQDRLQHRGCVDVEGCILTKGQFLDGLLEPLVVGQRWAFRVLGCELQGEGQCLFIAEICKVNKGYLVLDNEADFFVVAGADDRGIASHVRLHPLVDPAGDTVNGRLEAVGIGEGPEGDSHGTVELQQGKTGGASRVNANVGEVLGYQHVFTHGLRDFRHRHFIVLGKGFGEPLPAEALEQFLGIGGNHEQGCSGGKILQGLQAVQRGRTSGECGLQWVFHLWRTVRRGSPRCRLLVVRSLGSLLLLLQLLRGFRLRALALCEEKDGEKQDDNPGELGGLPSHGCLHGELNGLPQSSGSRAHVSMLAGGLRRRCPEAGLQWFPRSEHHGYQVPSLPARRAWAWRRYSLAE